MRSALARPARVQPALVHRFAAARRAWRAGFRITTLAMLLAAAQGCAAPSGPLTQADGGGAAAPLPIDVPAGEPPFPSPVAAAATRPWLASFPGFCDSQKTKDAVQQHRMLKFADAVRGELERSDAQVALVSRSGMNLDRFDIRYSHAGISVRDSVNVPWSVRQLYYACDEGRPRIFDQGVAGFLFNSDEVDTGHVSLLLLPEQPARAIRDSALDDRVALALLAGTYSANANPYSTQYQNCNQWVIETLAVAMGQLQHPQGVEPSRALRQQAQTWLRAHGYEPPHVEVKSHALMFAGSFAPLLRFDDHPAEERFDRRFRLSLPGPIEDWVIKQIPGARRVELCRNADQIVIRHEGPPLGAACTAGPGDRVLPYA